MQGRQTYGIKPGHNLVTPQFRSPLCYRHDRAAGWSGGREREEEWRIVSTPALRLAKEGCELSIGATAVWSQHPQDSETQCGFTLNRSEKAVLPIIVYVSELLVLHLHDH
jgi:hypothetical protein